MSNQRLRDRQADIVAYLLDPYAFGAGTTPSVVPPALHGLDPARLKINGLFSLGKRRDKIVVTLPLTWAHLGNSAYNFHDFASRYPQHDLTRYANAVQFFRYLQTVWEEIAPSPAWLPDLARYEIDFAAVESGEALRSAVEPAPNGGGKVRRHPSVLLSQYAHDIRPLVEGEPPPNGPDALPMLLAMRPKADGGVDVFELDTGLFGILKTLDGWWSLDAVDKTDDAWILEMIAELHSLGLVEMTE